MKKVRKSLKFLSRKDISKIKGGSYVAQNIDTIGGIVTGGEKGISRSECPPPEPEVYNSLIR